MNIVTIYPKFPDPYYPLSSIALGEERNYDYGFRDYSPVAMRFTTVDPIRSGSNWYSYVSNDPINFIDPFGLCSESDNSSTEIGYTGVVGAEMIALGAVTLGVGIYGLNPPMIIGGSTLIITGNELATTGGIESTQEYIQNVADAISDFATQ